MYGLQTSSGAIYYIVLNSFILVLGTKLDPTYREVPALIFERDIPLYEGYKGAVNFTNTIIEDDIRMPHRFTEIEDAVTVPKSFLEILDRRLIWCNRGDGIIQKLPRVREFPRLNFCGRVQVGIHPIRKEMNILRAFYDVSDQFVSNQYEFIDRRKVAAPYCVVPFLRDGKRIILNLKSDFVTTSNGAARFSVEATQVASQQDIAKSRDIPNSFALPRSFTDDTDSTLTKDLINIHPVDWRINFNAEHFYDEDFDFAIPKTSSVHTIYFCNNNFGIRAPRDRMMKGKAAMFAYGFAVAQARRLYGNDKQFDDEINYTVLPEPVSVQAVWYNHGKQNLGIVGFQLNTLSFDSKLKNQIWFDGPYDVNEERETIMRKLAAIHLNGGSDRSALTGAKVAQAN